MSEPDSSDDRSLALSKLRSASAQLGLPYEVLKGLALVPALQHLPSNKARRFNVYQAAASALGVVSGGPPCRYSAAPRPTNPLSYTAKR